MRTRDNTEPPSPTVNRPSRAAVVTLGAIVAGLVGIGLLVGRQAAPLSPGGQRMFPRAPGPPPDVRTLLRHLGVGSVTWYACALALPLLWWLALRLPLTQQRVWRSLGLQLAAVVGLIAVASVVQYAVTYQGAPYRPSFGGFAQVALVANALPLLVAATAANIVAARRRAVRVALEAERLRAELAESRLVAVTSQLQPHFLFNTLQSISALIHKDPAAADAMLARLADLLRDVLRRSRSALVPLREELRMTEAYLDLARVRFAERLQTALDVDPGAHRALVPMLLLQPFIENALKHGVGPQAAGGTVGVTARQTGGRLIVTVWDDGVGLAADAASREGTGITNTRERLRHAFGDDQSLDVAPRGDGGVQVTINVPFRPEPQDA